MLFPDFFFAPLGSGCHHVTQVAGIIMEGPVTLGQE